MSCVIWKMKEAPTLQMFTGTHCSYLDIYISQNIRLCKGDFEGQFQTSLQARIIIFVPENSYLLYPFSFYFLHELSNPLLFALVAATPMSWHVWVAIWWKNVTQTYQPFWNSSNSVQKAVNLTTPAKNRRKMSLRNLILRPKSS